MLIRVLALVLLPALTTLTAAQQGYKPLPKLVIHAKYVLVTTYQGYDLTNPNMTPDDRRAVVDVQNAIKKWGRYELAYQPADADLIFLVRKGRILEAQPGVRISAGSTIPVQVGSNVPVDAGDPRDMLAMYDASDGIDSAPLWRNSEAEGLNPPSMNLIKQLRQAIDKAAKIP